MSRIVDIEPLLHKYDGMNEGTEFSPIHFINDLMALEEQPSEDYDYKALWEQVSWERDVALEQLEQLGYSLGEKIRTDKDCISREYLLDRWFTVFNDDGVGLRVVLKKDIEDAPSVATQRNNASEIIRRIEQARDKDKNAGEYPYNRCIEIVREVMDGSMDESYR